jgi:hypothetical protein
MGDTSDNIPGVRGGGEKTAVELIREFGSLEALYARLGEVKKEAVRVKLAASREQAFLSRELLTVKTDLELPWSFEDLRRRPIRRDALLAFAQHHELQRLVNLAEAEGVADAAAGPRAPARNPERHGTAAETPARGVRLAEAVRPRSRARARPRFRPPLPLALRSRRRVSPCPLPLPLVLRSRGRCARAAALHAAGARAAAADRRPVVRAGNVVSRRSRPRSPPAGS